MKGVMRLMEKILYIFARWCEGETRVVIHNIGDESDWRSRYINFKIEKVIILMNIFPAWHFGIACCTLAASQQKEKKKSGALEHQFTKLHHPKREGGMLYWTNSSCSWCLWIVYGWISLAARYTWPRFSRCLSYSRGGGE